MKTYICFIVVFIECFVGGNSQDQKVLFEGDACKTIDNEPGVCVRLSLCSSAKAMLKKNVHPIHCGFVKDIPIVCCLKTDTIYTYLAEKKCAYYNRPVVGIIKGEDAKLKEFPYMAALGYTYKNKKVWLCGGTLISEQYILTAAHCLLSFEYGPVEWVRLGIIDINDPDDDEVYGHKNLRVINTIRHPLYKPPFVYHDIGLVQINKFIKPNLFVKPACLYMNNSIPEGTELLATGWGLTEVGGNQSSILQKTTLDLFSKEECDPNYNNAGYKRKLKHGILHKQQICAGGKTSGTDSCQGDSGGPLAIKKTVNYIDIFYVAGITSFGKSCGLVNVPGIYTRVSIYVPWIESVIWQYEM